MHAKLWGGLLGKPNWALLDTLTRTQAALTQDVSIVDPSQVGLTSTFAALSRPLAQKMGWGLPNFGNACSQHGVPETGVDLRVWRRQVICSWTWIGLEQGRVVQRWSVRLSAEASSRSTAAGC